MKNLGAVATPGLAVAPLGLHRGLSAVDFVFLATPSGAQRLLPASWLGRFPVGCLRDLEPPWLDPGLCSPVLDSPAARTQACLGTVILSFLTFLVVSASRLPSPAVTLYLPVGSLPSFHFLQRPCPPTASPFLFPHLPPSLPPEGLPHHSPSGSVLPVVTSASRVQPVSSLPCSHTMGPPSFVPSSSPSSTCCFLP